MDVTQSQRTAWCFTALLLPCFSSFMTPLLCDHQVTSFLSCKWLQEMPSLSLCCISPRSLAHSAPVLALVQEQHIQSHSFKGLDLALCSVPTPRPSKASVCFLFFFPMTHNFSSSIKMSGQRNRLINRPKVTSAVTLHLSLPGSATAPL